MRYYDELTKIGIGTDWLPNRKKRSLVYIDGNREIVIGTVSDEVLFEKGVEALITKLVEKKNGTTTDEKGDRH